MRPVVPAPPKRTRYPRLVRAWRILVATPIALLPSLVHADATLPHDGNGKQGPTGDKPAPPVKAPPPEWPNIDGDIVMPHPPIPPPPPKAKEKEKPKKAPQKSAMVLHRHAPDEPCRPRARRA